MYSVNVPVPWAVQRLAASLEPDLADFASIRDRHTLVVKRLDGRDLNDLHRIRERLRPVLRGVAPFEVRVTGVGAFEDPPLGDAPVVYLAVEAVAPGDRDAGDRSGAAGVATDDATAADPLRALHDRLVREFGAVSGLEEADYAPHVTLARGWDGPGDPATAVARLRERDIDGARWTVDELGVWTREYKEIAARVPLRD
ncbi:2'-5' RNA ligase family protein [Halobaculum gomorrense]|uniref:2'-5' RNA ligase superfamily protein n=1 Tax=Halobaculum gomorrense TaxID=43928 RepID=A0A1M5T6D7_9EURY|nr:2'-5' RNA ligase family protein [Halobaculum gomorrense]SHH46299.1 2'-5' RNA ligase superfamily protein [Halobaculum gomorrense]